MAEPPERGASQAEERADARSGYEVAANLWVYEGNLIWSRFTAMVYANTIVVATIGLVITSPRSKELAYFRVGLSLLGLVLCVVWWSLVLRGFQYFHYWIRSTRELERTYLAPTVTTVVRGEEFSSSGRAAFRGDAKGLSVWRPRFPRTSFSLLNVEWASYAVIVAFVVLYLLAAIAH